MKQIKIITLILTVLVLVAGCKKPEPQKVRMVFKATLEQPTNNDNNSKVYMENERWIYWEVDDEISIAGDNSGGAVRARLSQSHYSEDNGTFNGIFVTELTENATYYLGLHPYSANNVIDGSTGSKDFTVRICLPDEQPRRTDERGDLTFDKQVYPMVAWYGDNGGDTANLDFHALASIVRLQLFNNSGTAKTLTSIEITSRDNKQLKGMFNVNSYKIEDPYLTAADNTAANQTVTLTCGEGLTFGSSNLYTFYLVLPAYGGRGVTTEYQLTMTVNTGDGSTFTKNFTVNTRRTGMTNMKAMGINEWNQPANDPDAGSAGLSGCGTASRPFKIYNVADLQYLRDCYNATGTRTINGQPITEDTYITLMRSDLVLTRTNWTVGIRDFVGHFTSENHQSNPGIIDSAYFVPLFESISETGVVEGIILKSAYTDNSNNATGVSPFCAQNAGTIRNCVLTTIPGVAKFNLSIFSPMAGICVNNTGTIEGCRCEARIEVQSNQNFAGICMHNRAGGKIIGCQAASMTPRVTAKAAGICYENAAGGTVRDCYIATDITGSTADWGGIVYENSGTVEHCYFSATGHIYTTKSVGGIVRNNLGGTVNYCWVAGPLQGRNAGGIVDSLIGGQVVNCFNTGNAMITVTAATSVGGGLVGYLKGGSIANSYVNDIFIMRQLNGATIGGIVGAATGGTVDNCYSWEDNNVFFGTSSSATYTNCHLIEGSQSMTGISNIGDDATAFNSLYTSLQSVASGNSGYYSWTQSASGTAPELTTYAIPATTARR